MVSWAASRNWPSSRWMSALPVIGQSLASCRCIASWRISPGAGSITSCRASASSADWRLHGGPVARTCRRIAWASRNRCAQRKTWWCRACSTSCWCPCSVLIDLATVSDTVAATTTPALRFCGIEPNRNHPCWSAWATPCRKSTASNRMHTMCASTTLPRRTN